MPPTQPIQSDLILPLGSESATLQLVGGNGTNLSRMLRVGFPVPGGFLLTTRAYQAFVEANAIEGRILAILPDSAALEDPAAIERASASIRSIFDAGRLPDGMAEAIRSAYAGLGRPAVALRSSAAAEDLPDTSFAGQQDTYLNVIGDDALLAAVKGCWGSLWTARAIAYRTRNVVSQKGIALCVVVQAMVESHTSGVMFAANPLTGLRTETVIDATYGLGEALVSGQVDPDHYVVDTLNHIVLQKKLGAKAISIRSQAGLQPGEILVCRGTDPSWTPLFLSAGGLVMETGGMMTHGAVVAREFGIPAIVGVDQATTRLFTGQTIQIDGSTGQIVILGE